MRSFMTRPKSKPRFLRLVNEGRVATLCIHGDDPRAVANAELVRRVLTQHGISIRSFLDEPHLMALIVIDPGFCTTVQDEGRPGYREWGVPLGGAFDRGSAELANALLGNPPSCAVLEFTLVGGAYRADCSMALALAGAPMEARIVGPNATECTVQVPSSFSLREGDKLILGRAGRSQDLPGGQRRVANPASSGQPVVGTAPSGRRDLAAASGTIATRRSSEPAGGRRPTTRSASSRALTAGLIRS